jgi:hypothetical protein
MTKFDSKLELFVRAMVAMEKRLPLPESAIAAVADELRRSFGGAMGSAMCSEGRGAGVAEAAVECSGVSDADIKEVGELWDGGVVM